VSKGLFAMRMDIGFYLEYIFFFRLVSKRESYTF